MNAKKWSGVLALSILCGSLAAQDAVNVLFVGNSLTATNDVPSLVVQIAAVDGVSIVPKSFLLPNYSLEDHWNEKKVIPEIRSQKYQFVVAQQGPSALPESQVLLMDYAKRFSKECRKNNCTLAFYMVWPSKARSFDFENVIKSYTQTATATKSILCPAGEAWREAWKLNPNLALYGPDNFHPDIRGSVLAAMVIYASLMKKKDLDFLTYGNLSVRSLIPEEDFNALKAAAITVLNR